jgi:hypothetical protein|tara:strand:- start:1179 stop:1526 length:348 start_codon:yes stop_codon:yes gene_type:complete
MLKTLVVSIFLIFLGTKADAFVKGQYVFVAYLCNNLEPLLRIVAEDTRNSAKAYSMMKDQFYIGNCTGLRPIELKIKEVIVTYKDANNSKTQLLSLDTGSADSFIVVLVPEEFGI